MGKKSKSKQATQKSYKTPEQEAKRALVNILNYKLEVFCLIVDLDVNDSSSMATCLGLIQEKAPNCSVLLVSESGPVPVENVKAKLSVAALSAKPTDLIAKEWVDDAVAAMEGIEKNFGSFIESGPAEGTYVQLLDPELGVSILKEKDKALAAAFQWLKEKGFGLESESDSEENFMASFEFEDE